MIKKKLQLVLLVGGRSIRMGYDKSSIKIDHLKGFDFFENALSLLLSLQANLHLLQKSSFPVSQMMCECSLVISCRKEQHEKMLSRVQAFLGKQQKIEESREACRENIFDFLKEASIEFFKQKSVETIGKYPPKHEQKREISFFLDKGDGVCEAMIGCLEKGASDTLFIPCDVPFLSVSILEKLVNTWLSSHKEGETALANFVFEPDFTFMTHSVNNGNCSKTKSTANKRVAKPLDTSCFSSDRKRDFFIPSQKKDKDKIFSKKRQESLIAIYTQKSLPFLKECVRNNVSLQNAIPQELSQKILYTQGEAHFFQNINREEDVLYITSRVCS